MKTSGKNPEKKETKTASKEEVKKLKEAYEKGNLNFNSKEIAKAIIKDLKPNKNI